MRGIDPNLQIFPLISRHGRTNYSCSPTAGGAQFDKNGPWSLILPPPLWARRFFPESPALESGIFRYEKKSPKTTKKAGYRKGPRIKLTVLLAVSRVCVAFEKSSSFMQRNVRYRSGGFGGKNFRAHRSGVKISSPRPFSPSLVSPVFERR